MTKSRDLKSEMFKGQASRPYNKTGTHLLYNNSAALLKQFCHFFQKLHLQNDKTNVYYNQTNILNISILLQRCPNIDLIYRI